MYATEKNITEIIPNVNIDSPVCARYLKYPDLTGNKRGEGGLRLKGKYKAALSGKPLVSIISVVYNFAHKLERAITSVLSQTYDNIEYIIVDGGSIDGTLEVIQKYECVIDYYVSEPDKGIYHAMNKGLELATGDYIAFLNSSDWYTSDAVEISINNIISSGADYSAADGDIVTEKGVFFRKNIAKKSNFNELAILGNPTYFHGTMFISNKSYNTIGQYDDSYKIYADFRMMLLLIKHAFRPIIIPETIFYFEIGGISTTRKLSTSLAEKQKLLKEFYPSFAHEELCFLVELIFNNYWDENRSFLFEKILSRNCFNDLQKDFLKQLARFNHFEFHQDIAEQLHKRPILIWGTGNGGKYTYEWLENMNFKATGFIDNDKLKWGKTFLKLPIYSPQSINIKNVSTNNVPYVFIGTMYLEEIKEQLVKLGYKSGENFFRGRTFK